jgi:hypothetical protein
MLQARDFREQGGFRVGFTAKGAVTAQLLPASAGPNARRAWKEARRAEVDRSSTPVPRTSLEEDRPPHEINERGRRVQALMDRLTVDVYRRPQTRAQRQKGR